MAEKHKDQEFLEVLIKSLVTHPEDVKVTREVDEMGVLLSLRINPEDMGQIIGRQVQPHGQLEVFLRIVGLRNNARVNLKIEEPEGSTRRAPRVNADEELKL